VKKLLHTAGVLVLIAGLSSCAGGPTFAELFDDSAAGEGTGIQGAALVRAVVILARHPATVRQRQVAEQNAARAVAALEREIRAQAAQPSHSTTARKQPKKKTMPARIAVRTVKDEQTAPKADAAVMLYDVQARRIVGNEVYDIEQEPNPGATVRFDTQVVRYVGVSAF
jgi:hypothetical protein